jgi:predicted nucleotide-binding protein
MNKPRIFLGSSGKQANLLQAITRGLEDVADVEPWTTTFNPGRSTLDRLVELSQEVDFAAFVFAQDDWTTTDASQSGQASPRDNVVFEAGLFGGALGIRRGLAARQRAFSSFGEPIASEPSPPPPFPEAGRGCLPPGRRSLKKSHR